MIGFILEPISKMPNLKSLNLSKNTISGFSIVALLKHIIKEQKETNSGPIKLQKLNVTGCWLEDDGITDLLPILASEFP